MQRVKELTDEREKLARDFKDENDELKGKIRELENEVEYLTEELDRQAAAAAGTPTTTGKLSLSRAKSDVSSDG